MASAPTSRRPKTFKQPHVAPAVDLSAVIMAATPDEPRVLTVRATPQQPDGLPSGPLQSQHRTLEMGLRTWVAEQTQLTLGYVEQLYTFGDRDRAEAADPECRACPVDCLPGARPRGASGRTGSCRLAELVRLSSVGGLARRPPNGAQGHRAGLEGLGPYGRWQTSQDLS